MLNPPFVDRFNRTGSRWASKTRSDTVCYPTWLAYATGWLEISGHEVRLIDAPARCLTYEDVLKQCMDFQPDMIAIDTATSSISNDVVVARNLKKEIESPVVMIGPHASALPCETLETSGADHVIVGEYDIALGRILSGQESSRLVEGIPFTNLDSLPFASKIYKEHLNIDDYFYSLCRYPEVQIMSARGCIHHCNYCVWAHVLTGRNVRYRSVMNIVDELEYIHTELSQVKDIIIEDDTFTDNKRRVTGICEEIKKRKLDIDWIVNARADVSYNILKELKSAGCRMLIVGYESGEQEILNMAKKGITVSVMREFAKNTKRVGLEVMGCFMIGLIGETPETARKTFEFAKEVDPDFYFFSPATPFPGTEFYNTAKERGFLVAEDWSDWTDENGYLKNIISYPNFSNREISETIDDFLWKFAFRKKFILKSLKKIIRHPVTEGSRFARSLIYGLDYFSKRRKKSSRSDQVSRGSEN